VAHDGVGVDEGRARRHPHARERHAPSAGSAQSVIRAMEPTNISVEIFGQRYPIRSTLDAEYIKRLASYVDGKIRAAGDPAPSGDPVRLAVLAALNIADELFRNLETAHASTGTVAERAAELERLLDRVLIAD